MEDLESIGAPGTRSAAGHRLAMLDELDPALSLMYFALKGMTRDADRLLALEGLSRAHHRILFVIARRDGIGVGALADHLGISAQALHGPLKQLTGRGFVSRRRDPVEHRRKILHLSAAGADLERRASDAERRVMRNAFNRFSPNAVQAWYSLMEAITIAD